MVNSKQLDRLNTTIPFHWREANRAKNGKSAQCLAYLDARDVMDLLDNTCGKAGWKSEFFVLQDRLYGMISIEVEHKHQGSIWVSKSDVGTESNTEREKGNASDAFKRAAVHWGIGRFLYRMDRVWVNVNDSKQLVDDSGKRIWDLSDHCNRVLAKKYPKKYSYIKGIFKIEGLPSINMFKDGEQPATEEDAIADAVQEVSEEKVETPAPPPAPAVDGDAIEKAVSSPPKSEGDPVNEELLDLNRRIMGCRSAQDGTTLANEYREFKSKHKVPKAMDSLITESFLALKRSVA